MTSEEQAIEEAAIKILKDNGIPLETFVKLNTDSGYAKGVAKFMLCKMAKKSVSHDCRWRPADMYC